MSVEVTEMIASFDSTLPPVQPAAAQPMATPQPEPAVPQDVLLDGVVPEDGAMCQIPRRRIRRNPASDPRKHRNRGVYEGMVESFRRDGILQPITVRPVPMDENGCDLEVVMGNTRFEGAHDAGITTMPAVVRHVDLREATIMAGVENLQRANLSPVEEGGHAASLLMKLNNDHEEVCNILGLDAEEAGLSHPAYACERGCAERAGTEAAQAGPCGAAGERPAGQPEQDHAQDH